MIVSVLCLFLAVPWVSLHCVIVVFPDHTQWRSQNAEKVTHINGRLLDQAMIIFNYIPFRNGNFS